MLIDAEKDQTLIDDVYIKIWWIRCRKNNVRFNKLKHFKLSESAR